MTYCRVEKKIYYKRGHYLKGGCNKMRSKMRRVKKKFSKKKMINNLHSTVFS